MKLKYQYILEYDSRNTLQTSKFNESRTAASSSVTLTRDNKMNTRVIVFADDFADAIKQADRAIGTSTLRPAPEDNYLGDSADPRISLISRQIEAREKCRKILMDTSYLSDDSDVTISVGLFRFLVAVLDLARNSQLSSESEF